MVSILLCRLYILFFFVVWIVESAKLLEHEELKFKRYELEAREIYDLEITMSNGETITFDRYEGYFTLIIPVAKTCSGMKVIFSEIMRQIQDLKQLSKLAYAVEIIVFPYEYQSVHDFNPDQAPNNATLYEGIDCSDFEMEYSKQRNDKHPIHMMKMEKYFGDYVPPLFQMIQEAMSTDTIIHETTAFFLIYPELNILEYHYGKSLIDMKDILLEVTKILENVEF